MSLHPAAMYPDRVPYALYEWRINTLSRIPGMYDRNTGWTELSQHAYKYLAMRFKEIPKFKVKNIRIQCPIGGV